MPFWQYAILALLGPAAIIGAAVIAWKAQRRIAIRRATIDFISRHEVDNEEWRVAKRRFSEITSEAAHPEPLIALLSPKTPEQWEDHIVITSLLNHLEAIAVAIKHESISKEIYRDWNKTNYVKAWAKAQSFITESRKRTGRQTTWEHFQELAEEWEQEAAEQHK